MKLKFFLAAALLCSFCTLSGAAESDLIEDVQEETAETLIPDYAPSPAVAGSIEKLLRGSKGVNSRASDGSTPLMLAARAGDAALVERLLNDGAKVDARSKKGATALMNAAFFCENADVAKKLIAAGANVNAADKQGWTPLMLALYASESTDTAEALQAAGADVNARSKSGWTPLMLALRTGKPAPFIRTMLKKWGAYPEGHKNAKDGTTPMMIACQYSSDVQTVKELYAAGAEVMRPRRVPPRPVARRPVPGSAQPVSDLVRTFNISRAIDAYRAGDMPLHFAARNDTGSAPQIIRFLVDNRAEVDCRNGGGWTPLMTAAQFSSHPETVKTLLDAGAQVNARKYDGMNAVMLAVSNASPQANAIVKMLIDAGADLESTDGRGRTAFEVAARSGRSLETLRLVAQHETASSRRMQNARLAAAPAAANVTRYARVMNAPDKRSKAAIPYHETRPGALLGNKLRSLDLLPPLEELSADVSGDVTSEDLAVEIREPGVFVSRLNELLSSYDLLPPPPASSDEALSADAILSADVQSADSALSADMIPAGADQTAAPLSADAAPVALVSSSDISAASSLPPQPLPAQAPKPGVPVKPAAPAPVQPQTPEEEFPAETFSVTELLSAHSVSETDAELARQLDETVNEAARAKDERREDEVYPLSLAGTSGSGKGGSGTPAALLGAVNRSARLVSRPAFQAARLRASQFSRYTKRRGLKKMRPQFRRDRVEITPLMLAAVNPSDAAPDIIAWLLERGEQLEARDGEGRTALICAVRYNSSLLAAEALISAGADTHVRFNGNDLRRLLRFNNRMSAHDKKELAKLLSGRK